MTSGESRAEKMRDAILRHLKRVKSAPLSDFTPGAQAYVTIALRQARLAAANLDAALGLPSIMPWPESVEGDL